MKGLVKGRHLPPNYRNLEQMAQNNFSSFSGEKYEGYTGRGDISIDFGGISNNFANEIEEGRIFQIDITLSTVGSNPTLAIWPGWYLNETSLLTPDIITDGTIATGITATGSPNNIAQWHRFHLANPGRISGIKIVSDKAAQIQQTMNIAYQSPYRSLEDENIRVSTYVDEDTFNDKQATVRYPFQLDDQSLITMPFIDNSTCTLIFFAGAVKNQAKELATKANLAYQNMRNDNGLASMARKGMV